MEGLGADGEAAILELLHVGLEEDSDLAGLRAQDGLVDHCLDEGSAAAEPLGAIVESALTSAMAHRQKARHAMVKKRGTCCESEHQGNQCCKNRGNEERGRERQRESE